MNFNRGDDLETVEIMSMHAGFGFDLDEEEDLVLSQEPGLTITFGGVFDTIRHPPHVANFLRTLMSYKCAQGEVLLPLLTQATDAQDQPLWLQSRAIVDAIVQYFPFEDQAGKLRLISQAFLHSSMRQLRTKIEDIRVIGSSDSVSFIATVRQGWSEKHLSSEEDVVEDALRLASCRCMRRCEGMFKCPTVNEPITFSGYKVKEGTVDLNETRRELANRGCLWLTDTDPSEMYNDCEPSNTISCSFGQKEINIFQLCDILEKVVDENSDYDHFMGGDPVMLSYFLRRKYHVLNDMTSKQFLRSIFLVLSKTLAATAMTETGKVSIGKAKSKITSSSGSQFFSRMKEIYRFSAAQLGELEISLDKHSSYDMDWY